MTGKEAKELSEKIKEITNFLFEDRQQVAFFSLGKLYQELSTIVSIDQSSFNPTVKKELEQ